MEALGPPRAGPQVGWSGLRPRAVESPALDIRQGPWFMPSKTWELEETGHAPACVFLLYTNEGYKRHPVQGEVKNVFSAQDGIRGQPRCRWGNPAVQVLTKGSLRVYGELLETNSETQTT